MKTWKKKKTKKPFIVPRGVIFYVECNFLPKGTEISTLTFQIRGFVAFIRHNFYQYKIILRN